MSILTTIIIFTTTSDMYLYPAINDVFQTYLRSRESNKPYQKNKVGIENV